MAAPSCSISNCQSSQLAPGMVKAMRLVTGHSFSQKLIPRCGSFCSESWNINWLEGTRLEPALFDPDVTHYKKNSNSYFRGGCLESSFCLGYTIVRPRFVDQCLYPRGGRTSL